jgi:ferritin-like protein
MDNDISTGMNRTGMKTSPVHARELLEVRELQKTAPAPEIDAIALRASYLAEAEPVGSMPPPPSLKGMAGTAMKALTGKKMHVLLDKLGERAAYERTGTRLYDMMLQKVAAAPGLPEGMTIEGVQQIRDEEHAHFQLLATAIEELGADPTVMTPCANVTGVQGMGLVQAMGEPRLTIAQALSTLLAAEVIDNASWELLIELAQQFGQDELAQRFSEALAAEQRHEATVRAWLSAALAEEAQL